MPANLTPQYYEAEKKYREAKTPQEKMIYLQEMMAIIPKHKGTEKIQGDLKSKMSKLKEMSERSKKSGGASTAWYQVDKQGAGQVALVGLPNAGKSALLNKLTNANAMVADYPYTTISPLIGMMDFEDIKIQIVDTPPLADDTPAWLYSIYRSADMIIIMLDVHEDLETQLEIIREMLSAKNVVLNNPDSNNRTIVVVSKSDDVADNDGTENFRGKYGKQFAIINISVKTGNNIEALKQRIFEGLNIIRVYTKRIGQPPVRKDPVVFRVGTTVIEAAEHIHKDFKNNLQYTRLWNDSGYTGQRVEKTHILKDGDIIEFHV